METFGTSLTFGTESAGLSTVLVRVRGSDGYTLWEAPDNVSMAAVALAIGAGGALHSLKTTVLLTVDETMDALRKAGEVGYRVPGS